MDCVSRSIAALSVDGSFCQFDLAFWSLAPKLVRRTKSLKSGFSDIFSDLPSCCGTLIPAALPEVSCGRGRGIFVPPPIPWGRARGGKSIRDGIDGAGFAGG